jgi:hypothetical protein
MKRKLIKTLIILGLILYSAAVFYITYSVMEYFDKITIKPTITKDKVLGN